MLAAVALLILPSCVQKNGDNKTDGLKDAFDARPNEKMRDLGEDLGKAGKDVGRDLKDAVKEK